eukprot:SAG22_NODE_715_length_7716_cov_9.535513_2_plen_279_part_00
MATFPPRLCSCRKLREATTPSASISRSGTTRARKQSSRIGPNLYPGRPVLPCACALCAAISSLNLQLLLSTCFSARTHRLQEAETEREQAATEMEKLRAELDAEKVGCRPAFRALNTRRLRPAAVSGEQKSTTPDCSVQALRAEAEKQVASLMTELAAARAGAAASSQAAPAAAAPEIREVEVIKEVIKEMRCMRCMHYLNTDILERSRCERYDAMISRSDHVDACKMCCNSTGPGGGRRRRRRTRRAPQSARESQAREGIVLKRNAQQHRHSPLRAH